MKLLKFFNDNFSHAKIHFYASYIDSKGRRVYKDSDGKVKSAPNGKYLPDGTLAIDLNAGEQGQGLILYTVSHDITHMAKDLSPEKWKEYADFLFKHYSKNHSVEELIQYEIDFAKKKGRQLTRDEAYDEAVARASERMLVDVLNGTAQNKLAELNTEHKDIVTKIKELFEKLIARIKGFYNEIPPESRSAQIVHEMKDVAEQLQAMWLDMIVDSGTSQKKASAESEIVEDFVKEHKDGIKYYDRGYGAIREVLAKKGLDELSKKLGSYFPLSASFDATIRADNTPLTMTTVKKDGVLWGKGESDFTVGKKSFRNTYGIKTDVHIKQMDIDAVLYTDVTTESISKIANKKDRTREQAILDVIPHLKEILSNSILASVERIKHTGNKHTALYGYRLYNLYWLEENNKKTPRCLVCTVVQNTEQAEGYVFRDIENVTIDHGLPGENTDMPASANDDTHTISQLYRFVKGVKRENGGIKYSLEEKNKYLFHYSKRNDGVLYSDRDSTYLGENNDIRYSDRDYSYEALTSKPNMTLTTINNVVQYKKPTKSMRDTTVNNAVKNAKAVGKTNSTGGVSVFVDDVGNEVTLSKKSLAHGLDRRFSENLPATLKAGEILKNAIRINELTPKRKDASASYVLIGAGKSQNGDLSVVEFVVNEFTNEVDSIEVLKSLNTKKEVAVLNAPPFTNDSLRITTSEISIAQLLDFVNKHFPDILPESVLRHYGYDERPKGVLGESALYSDRSPDAFSNRSLLTNALEIVAKEGEERNLLRNYKTKLRLIEAEQARNEIKKLVIINAVETTEISQLASHKDEHTHQWLDENGWDSRMSYVLTKDGMIYPVELYIAKAIDGRNILYDANVKIKEGISIDKNATSLRSKKNTKQAVKLPMPSNNRFYHKKYPMSSGKGKKELHSERDSASFSKELYFCLLSPFASSRRMKYAFGARATISAPNLCALASHSGITTKKNQLLHLYGFAFGSLFI